MMPDHVVSSITDAKELKSSFRMAAKKIRTVIPVRIVIQEKEAVRRNTDCAVSQIRWWFRSRDRG